MTERTPLDPAYRPLHDDWRAYELKVAGQSGACVCELALERDGGAVARLTLTLGPAGVSDEATFRYVERQVKFLLWSAGGWRLHVAGALDLAARLAAVYAPGGARAFDAAMMSRIYERSFTVASVPTAVLPPVRDAGLRLGGHHAGCRLGFDLGASDYKVAAVRDGVVVFSAELPWHPKPARDPAYHAAKLREGLRMAAQHLPRVDAIGGSSAGIIVNGRPRVASLFRGVPDDRFEAEVAPLFDQVAQEWGVPVTVLNDGDVTALATGRPATLGIALGSSEAAGYVDRNGAITGRLSELAFAPVDAAPAATVEEWSGDRGVGASYFSQQAVARLAVRAGFAFASDMPLPERLAAVQARAAAGDPSALAIFEQIGLYLAHTLPLYRRFYDFDAVLLLGRVMSGPGGDHLLATARTRLAEVGTDASALQLITPDERMRRLGQAVAAAGLPASRQSQEHPCPPP